MTAITCLGKSYEVHPAAELFPMLPEAELRELADDISKHGLLVPIIRYGEQILDGRNRLRACALAEYEPQFEEWDEEGDDPVAFVVSLNRCRRHMSESQLAALAVDLKRIYEQEAVERGRANLRRGAEAPPDSPEAPTGATGKSAEKAAKAVGVSTRSVERAARVEARDPKLFEQVKTGEVTVRQAEQTITRRAQHDAIRKHVPAEGRFKVIVADPPWMYDVRADDETHRGRIPYEPMTLTAICAYLKPDRVADDAVLFLWVTNAHLVDGSAAKVLEAWGFEGKTLYTWVKVDAEGKPRFGGGNWGRNCTEHVILAVRGKPVIDFDAAAHCATVFFAERGEHSEKPDLFFTGIAEPLCPYPAPARLELFARKHRAGWVCDGVELEPVRAATTHASMTAPIEIDAVREDYPDDSATFHVVGDEIDESNANLSAVALRRAFIKERDAADSARADQARADLEGLAYATPIARREWGPGFGFLVDSLCKGDLVQVGGKRKGEALVDGRTKDKKLLVRFEKLDRKKKPDGYEDTPRAIEDAQVVAILHCAPRSIEPIGQSTRMVIHAWAKDELDVSREPKPEDVEHCWRYLLGMKSPLKANQRSEVGIQLAAAAARIRDEIDNPPPPKAPAPLPGAAAAITRPKRARGPVVDLGEL